MPYFDRFDICEAYKAIEDDYNISGILQERESNRRRNMSTDYQLARMEFNVGMGWSGFDNLEENGKYIYKELEHKYGFITAEELDNYYNFPVNEIS